MLASRRTSKPRFTARPPRASKASEEKWEAAYVASHLFVTPSPAGQIMKTSNFVVNEPGWTYEHDLEHRRFAGKELMHPAEAL